MSKVKTVMMPYEPVYVRNNTLSVDIDAAKRLLFFTDHKDKLAGHNEFQLDPRFQGGFGPGVNDLAMPFDQGVGTLRIANQVTDNVWLTRIDGSGKSKVMPSGYLQANGMMTVDKANHAITIQDFVLVNNHTSHTPLIIDTCDVTAGWTGIYGSSINISVENGRLKITGTTDASGRLVVQKTYTAMDLTNYPFLTMDIDCSGCNAYVLASSDTALTTYKYWQGSRFPVIAGGKHVFSLFSPVGTTGSMPSTVSGTTTYSSMRVIRAGITDAGASVSKTFYVDNIAADAGKWVAVECSIPDKMVGMGDEPKFFAYTWSGAAYTGSYFVGAYTSDGKLDGADGYGYFLDASISQNIYNCASAYTGTTSTLYPRGINGNTVSKGSYFGTANPSTFTYSSTYGTKYKIAFNVLMPPWDGRSGNSKMRFKLFMYYDDEDEQKLTDLASGKVVTRTGIVRNYNDYTYLPGSLYSYIAMPMDADFLTPATFMFMCDISVTNLANAYQGLWFDNARGAENRILVGGSTTNTILFQGSTSTTSAISISKTGAFAYDTRIKLAITYDGSRLKYWLNGSVINDAAMTGTLTNSLGKIAWIGQGYSNTYPFKGKIYSYGYTSTYDESILTDYFQGYDVNSRVKLYLKPKTLHNGSTTYTFSSDTQIGTGIELMQKPYVCFYDSIKNIVSYYIFTKKPTGIEYKYDEDGNIYNITFTLDSKTKVYKGQFTHTHLTADSNSDMVPNFVDSTETISIQKLIGHLDFIYDYVSKVDFNPGIVTNSFGLTTSNCPIIYPSPAGNSVFENNSRLLPLKSAQTPEGLTNYYDVSGKSTIRVYPGYTTGIGECKVFDTVTAGNTTESTWQRIYDVNHAFTGSCVIENGLVRIIFSGNPYVTVYYYYNSSWVSDRTMQSLVAGSDNCSVCTVTINSISADSVSVKTTLSGYTEYPTSLHNLNVSLNRGSYLAKFVLLSDGVFPNTPRFYDQRNNQCRFFINDAIHDTKFFTADTSYFLNTCSGIGKSMDPDKTAIRLFCEPYGNGSDGFRFRQYSSSNNLAYTYTPTGILPYTFYVGSIPYDCSTLYNEGESFSLWTYGSGTAGYGVTNDASAYPVAGNNVAWMLGTSATMSVNHSSELAGKRFLVYVRAKGSRVLTNSLAFYVDKHVSGGWVTEGSTVKSTLQTSFTTHVFDFTFPVSTAEMPIDNFRLSLYPDGAEDLTVTVDYMLLVPIEDIEWHTKRALVNLNATTSTEKV